MNGRRIWILSGVAAVVLLLLALGGATLAQDGEAYALRWWSADGGGAAFSAAGGYILGGTAGQPDAGIADAGGYTLRGGFWGGARREMLPAVADLMIGKDFVRAGAVVTYSVTATNGGPSAAAGALVSDTLPAALEGAAWRCEASGGAACGEPSGTGDLAQSVDLPAGGAVTFTISGTLPAGVAPINTAEVIPPAGVQDPNPANNVASCPSGYAVYLPLAVR